MIQLTENQLESLKKLPETIREEFLSSTQTCYRLHLTPEENLPLTVSKMGGFGYLPKSIEYPTNENGPLHLLAQINFSEFEPLADFPSKGLLAFYIDVVDDVYGAEILSTSVENGYRVYYFEEMDQDFYSPEEQQSLHKKQSIESDFYHLISRECKITGKLHTSFIFPGSMEAEKLLGFNPEDFSNEQYEIWELMNEFDDAPYHNIGGFPYFTQSDPRPIDTTYDTLLFQLDTDGNNDGDYIMWGDSGIGNFFINREKLKQKDFSDVLYNWDCC